MSDTGRQIVELEAQIAALQDGGSEATVGALIYSAGEISGPSVVFPPLDSALWDTDGFHVPLDGYIAIPVGLAGLYAISCYTSMAADEATTFVDLDLDIGGADPPNGFGSPSYHFSLAKGRFDQWKGGGSVEFPLIEGVIVNLSLTFGGGGTRTFNETPSGTFLSVTRIGPLPPQP